jgi:hypothetical protein
VTRTATALIVLGCACTSAGEGSSHVEPTGPPFLRRQLITAHARQFDTDIADRKAGTQGEQAASAYILGHLQQAGYVVLLDAVPVANLIRSTNVVAEPPSGGDPLAVVAVPYDLPPDAASARREGDALGVMMELARALRAAAPDHSVEFVALGAEYSNEGGGRLGSRRLAQALIDDDVHPLVLTFDIEDEGEPLLEGQVPPALEREARADFGSEVLGTGRVDEVGALFRQAGFGVVEMSGPPLAWGNPLLRYLESAG